MKVLTEILDNNLSLTQGTGFANRQGKMFNSSIHGAGAADNNLRYYQGATKNHNMSKSTHFGAGSTNPLLGDAFGNTNLDKSYHTNYSRGPRTERNTVSKSKLSKFKVKVLGFQMNP